MSVQAEVIGPRAEGGGRGAARRVLAGLAAAFGRERALAALGLAGVLLGSFVLAAMAARGRYVPPEGDLYKAATFDIAVGLYLLTLALIAPLADFTRRGRAAWRWSLVALVVYSYVVETGQIARGLDPRFTRAGTVADQINGGLFFLVALGITASFVVLARRFFYAGRSRAGGLLLVGLRYGCAAAVLGFATGVWLSVNQGAHVGESGNLLPLHAAGFHGLQAVPLVALLFAWAGAPQRGARRLVHAAGAAWLGLCVALAWQAAAGRSVTAPSAATALGAACATVWLYAAARAALGWRRAGFPVPARRPEVSG